eukprot:5193776-Amphidinium_carterae.1
MMYEKCSMVPAMLLQQQCLVFVSGQSSSNDKRCCTDKTWQSFVVKLITLCIPRQHAQTWLVGHNVPTRLNY